MNTGDRVRMRHAGLLGTIEAVLSNGYRFIVRWDSGLTTMAQRHELEVV